MMLLLLALGRSNTYSAVDWGGGEGEGRGLLSYLSRGYITQKTATRSTAGFAYFLWHHFRCENLKVIGSFFSYSAFCDSTTHRVRSKDAKCLC